MAIVNKIDFHLHYFYLTINISRGNVGDSDASVVFGLVVADLLHQSPMWIKARICPWHLMVPQKTIGTMACP
jgi:hypothetical protein